MDKWLDEIPKEEGLYWFFGWLNGYNGNAASVRHYIIKVVKSANKRLVYIMIAGGGGPRVLKLKKLHGYWQPLYMPEPPSLKDLDIWLHNAGVLKEE